MYRLRRKRKVTEIVDDMEEGFFLAAVIIAALTFIGCMLWAIQYSSLKSDAEDNVSLSNALYSYGEQAKDMSKATVKLRQSYAQQYVNLDSETAKRIGSSHTYISLNSSQWTQVKNVAKTGKPAILDTTHPPYLIFLMWPWALIVIASVMCIVGICSLMSYSYENDYGTTRIADINWKRPTTWLTVFALGPPVWIAMAVSRVLLIKTPYERERRQHQLLEDGEENWDSESTPQEYLDRKTYPSAPRVARTTYIALRTEAAKEYRLRKLMKIDEKIEDAQNSARRMSADLRNTQNHINQLRADRKETEASNEQETTTPELASQEFDRISRLPGVIATQVVNEKLRLIIRATHEYKGKLYDLGDWQIDIEPGVTRLFACGIRNDTRPEWRGGYPVYGYGNGGNFCFGSRQEILDEHMKKGQYLEAVSLAIDCLCGINKGERKHVPEAFYAIS